MSSLEFVWNCVAGLSKIQQSSLSWNVYACCRNSSWVRISFVDVLKIYKAISKAFGGYQKLVLVDDLVSWASQFECQMTADLLGDIDYGCAFAALRHCWINGIGSVHMLFAKRKKAVSSFFSFLRWTLFLCIVGFLSLCLPEEHPPNAGYTQLSAHI